MTDSTEPQQELDYPPVQVSQSLARLDIDSLIMKSHPHPPFEETGSSLEDSTYEVLGDSVYVTSDDEGHTESLASTSVFSDDEDDGGFEPERGDEIPQHQELPPTYAQVAAQAPDAPLPDCEDSILTEVPNMGSSESSPRIQLDESADDGQVFVSARGVIKTFDRESELPAALHRYRCPEIRFTIQAALSHRFMPVHTSFRILYIGDVPQWAENEITSQIGAALDASPGSSRSVMVGGQMEPYGPVMEVNHCANFETLDNVSKTPGILVTLSDDTQLTFSNKSCPNRGAHGFPDLVVFYYPSESQWSVDKGPCGFAQETFRLHKIPSIDIALARPYGSGASALTSGNLRMCIEGKDVKGIQFERRETLPIDHYSFVQLDPSQLNRHLAYITPWSASSDSSFPNSKKETFNIRNFLPKSADEAWRQSSGIKKAVVLFVMLMVTVSALVLMPVFTAGVPHLEFQTRTESSNINPVSLCSSGISDSSITRVPQTHTVASHSPTSSGKIGSKGLSIYPSKDRPQESRKERKKEEKFGGFEIETTDDHQFVLSPSPHFVKSKRIPQLQIQVSRESNPVSVQYVRSANGGYVVTLEDAYPLGYFNVSIVAHSKPLMQQSFQVKLGRKSMITQFMDTFNEDMEVCYSPLRKGLAYTRSLWGKGSVMYHELKGWELHQNSLKNSPNNKKLQHRFDTAKEYVQSVSEATWTQIRKSTASTRTSAPVLRARKNALGVRCKMEMWLGLSGKEKGDHESWACNVARNVNRKHHR